MDHEQCRHLLGNAGLPDWKEYPRHFGGALSKILVNRTNVGDTRLDFKMSCYAPMAYVEAHTHPDKEHVYFTLEGEAVLKVDGETHVMRKHDYVYVPANCLHAIANNGTQPLVFLVITVLL